MNKDLTPGESLPTIDLDIPMPKVKPLKKRNKITEMYYPDKISLKEFTHEITSSLEPFIANMKYANMLDPRFPEDWVSLYLHWCEMYNKGGRDMWKFTAFYFTDEMAESDGIHFADPNQNSTLMMSSSNDEQGLIDEMKCYKRRFMVIPTKDAIIILRHFLRSIERELEDE